MAHTQIELLLKYQQEDSKVLSIEREVASSEQYKNYSRARSFLKTAPEKGEALDSKAFQLKQTLERLKAEEAEISETLSEFENLDELVEGGADISFYKKNVAQLTENLKKIKADLAALLKSVEATEKEYKEFKKKTISVQDQYAEYRDVYAKYKQERLAEAEKIKADLDSLAKEIKPEVLKRYHDKREQRIFPVICTVANGRCSKCGMELSILGMDKIKRGEVIECENCHRFLYQE